MYSESFVFVPIILSLIFIGIPLFLIILSMVRAHKKGRNIWRSFFKTLIISVLVIAIFYLGSMFVFEIQAKRNESERQKYDLQQQYKYKFLATIYNNDQALCYNLPNPWNQVCQTAFIKSFDSCQQYFSEKDKFSIFDTCIKGVMWLTGDTAGCRVSYDTKTCNYIYDNMLIHNALLDTDINFCDHVKDDKQQMMCRDKVLSLYKIPSAERGVALKDLSIKDSDFTYLYMEYLAKKNLIIN